ncbi:MAG: tetratricopeptide repeat protein [Sphingomonas sp.]
MIPFALLLPVAAIVQNAPNDVATWRQLLKDGRVAEAVALVQAKARTGDADALDFLGWFYDTGTGLPKDPVKAADYYRRAAEAGSAHGQWRYGVMLDMGEGGLKSDPVAAMRWFEKARAQGFTNAMVSIGVMYSNGRGVPVDHAKAREAYLDGARHRNIGAFYQLGVIYLKGEGVPIDRFEALAWFLIGMTVGDDRAEKAFKTYSADLSDEDMQRLTERANALLDEHGIDLR